MPDVLVRRVSKRALDALKKQAERHGRSLQEELRLEIEGMAERAGFDFYEHARKLRDELLALGGEYSDSTTVIRRDRERDQIRGRRQRRGKVVRP